VLEPATLTVDRARLFFMEEPFAANDADILLVVVCANLGTCDLHSLLTLTGRVWRRAKTLRLVHQALRAIIGQTKYGPLSEDAAETLRAEESAFGKPWGLPGAHS